MCRLRCAFVENVLRHRSHLKFVKIFEPLGVEALISVGMHSSGKTACFS